MIHKQKKFEIALLLGLSGILLLLSLSCSWMCGNIRSERQASEKEAELEALSFRLANASDYLTSEVRKLAVTLDPIHLRNYWTEINVTQTREKVISRLKELNIPAKFVTER